MSRRFGLQRNGERGFGLIELMVAMVVGLLVTAGLLSIFTANSRSGKLIRATNRLQENARLVEFRLGSDLRMASYVGCANRQLRLGLSTPVDLRVRSTQALDGLQTYSRAGSGRIYTLPPKALLSGSACTGNRCKPDIPTLRASYDLPAVAVRNGGRAPGSDVLVLRVLDGPGRPLGVSMATPNDSVTLAAGGATGIAANTPVLISDCSSAEIFTATAIAGNALAHSQQSNVTPSLAHAYVADGMTRVYDYTTDLRERAYFVAYRTDPSGQSTLLGTLYVAENGKAQPLIDGVDRLIVRYRLGATGTWLRADDVESANAWGDVSSVSVTALLNSVELVLDTPADIAAIDSFPELAGGAAQSSDLPTGADRRARSEASFVVALRNPLLTSTP